MWGFFTHRKYYTNILLSFTLYLFYAHTKRWICFFNCYICELNLLLSFLGKKKARLCVFRGTYTHFPNNFTNVLPRQSALYLYCSHSDIFTDERFTISSRILAACPYRVTEKLPQLWVSQAFVQRDTEEKKEGCFHSSLYTYVPFRCHGNIL